MARAEIKETTTLVQHVILLYPALFPSFLRSHLSLFSLLPASNYVSYLSLSPLLTASSLFSLQRFPIFLRSRSRLRCSFIYCVHFTLFLRISPPRLLFIIKVFLFLLRHSYSYLLHIFSCATLALHFLSLSLPRSAICSLLHVPHRSIAFYSELYNFPVLVATPFSFPLIANVVSFLARRFIFRFLSIVSAPSLLLTSVRFTSFSPALFPRFFCTLYLSFPLPPLCSVPLFVRRHNFILGIRVYTGEAFVRELKCPAITRLAGSITCRATQFLRGSLLSLSYRLRDTVNEPGRVSILCQRFCRVPLRPPRRDPWDETKRKKQRPDGPMRNVLAEPAFFKCTRKPGKASWQYFAIALNNETPRPSD